MDSSSSPRPDAELYSRLRQQEVVSELGQQALGGAGLDELMCEACEAVAETLDAEYCKVLELLPGGDEVFLRQGVGWQEGLVGNATVPTDLDSQAGYTLISEKPVIVDDLRTESRFSGPDLLIEHDVVSGISVIIGSVENPWGVLGTHTTDRRDFSEHDATFVKNVANVLAGAIENRQTKRQLRAEESLKERIVETSPVGITVIDGEGRNRFANRRAEEILGRSREEITEFAHDDSRWNVVDESGSPLSPEEYPYRRVVETGEPVFDELIGLVDSDGDRIWLSTNCAPMFEDGEAVGAVFAFQDVTEQKKTEAELESVFGRISDAMYALDEEWRYTFVNEQAAELLGYSSEELLGESAWDVFPEAVGSDLYENFQEAMETQESVSFERYSEPLGIWAEVHAYPSETGLSVYFRNITEEKRMESELDEILGRVTDAFYALDEEWRFTHVNERAEELLQASEEELLGESLWETYPGAAEVDEVWDAFHEAMETQEPQEYELYFDPLEFWVKATVYPSETGVSVYFGDITERKERERELQLFRTLLDHSSDSVLVVDPETGRYLDVNETACQRRGYSREEFLELSVPELQTEIEDLDAWHSVVEELKAEGSITFEGEHRRKDGSTYPVEISSTYVELDQREYALGISRDVSGRKQRERRLRESEQRYRTLAEYFPNGIVTLFDHDLEYTLAAGQGFEKIPVEPADLEGEQFRDVWDAETADALEPAFQAALDGEERSVELAYADREWVVRAVPITDERGEVFAGMTMAQDVTGRVERERYLERYETIVETVNDGVYVVDEDGTFVMVNETYAEMLGYTRDELVGANASLVVDEEEIEAVEELHTAVEADEVEQPTLTGELRTADGELLPVEATFAPVSEGESGWHRVGVVRDVSERRARSRALEESERRHRTLVEHFPEGAVALFDENLEYTAIGGQLLEKVGIDPEDRLGHSVYELYPDDLIEEVTPYFEAALEGETNSFEVEFHGLHLHAHTLPVSDANEEVYAGMLVVQDVTERREYERKLEESNERLEQFAYAASHDLQEPLRMVSSYLQLIEHRYADELDEEGEEFLAFAVDGADRMREMIEGLLEYSRIESRGDPFEPVDLDGIVEDTKKDLQVAIHESDAELTVEELPEVEGDEHQLRQLFVNLLSNAIEYSGDEPPRIHVRAERADRDGKVTIAVEDEGIGIDPGDTDRIFEVFQRLHGHDEHAGAGIGLALCERIVERHGGRIWVESEPGEGSTFYVTLPTVENDDG